MSQKDDLLKAYYSSLSDYPFESQEEHDQILNKHEPILPDRVDMLERPVGVKQFNNTKYNQRNTETSTTSQIEQKPYQNIKKNKSTKKNIPERTTSKSSEQPMIYYSPSPILQTIPSMSLSHNGLLLLSLESFNLDVGSVYGLIGRNGVGKSTFLRELQTLPGVYLMPQEEQRKCACNPSHSDTLSYLNTFFDCTNEIIQMMTKFSIENQTLTICTCFNGGICNDGNSARTENNSIRSNCDKVNGTGAKTYSSNKGTSTQTHLNSNRTGYKTRNVRSAKTHGSKTDTPVLNGLDTLFLTPLYSTIAKSKLSGGQRRKLHLIISFLVGAPLVLLDEPTNMLDLDGISQLIKVIRNNTNTTFIIVSHDIYFLDCTVSHILEITQQKLFKYRGNYTAYSHSKKTLEKTELRNMEILREKKHKLIVMKNKYGVRKSSMVQSREKQFDSLLMKQSGLNSLETESSRTLSGNSLYSGSIKNSLISSMLKNSYSAENMVIIEGMTVLIGQNGRVECSKGIKSSIEIEEIKSKKASKGMENTENIKNIKNVKVTGISENKKQFKDKTPNKLTISDTSTNVLIEDIHLTLKPNQKTLVIGSNGAGKSSFLNMVRELLELKNGTRKNSNLQVNYMDYIRCRTNLKLLFVSQDHSDNFKPDDRVIPFLYRKYHDILAMGCIPTSSNVNYTSGNSSSTDPHKKNNDDSVRTNTGHIGSNPSNTNCDNNHMNDIKYSHNIQTTDETPVFDESMADKTLLRKIKQGLSYFSLHKDYHRIIELSGGEKTKLLLVLFLITEPDILLLDEITNNLDIETIDTVKEIIREYRGIVLAISHDRYFSEIFDVVYMVKKKRMVYHGKQIGDN